MRVSKEHNSIIISEGSSRVVIEPWGENAARVRMTCEAKMDEHDWALTEKVSEGASEIQIEEIDITDPWYKGAEWSKYHMTGYVYTLVNGKLTVKVNHEGWISYYNQKGELLTEEYWRNRNRLNRYAVPIGVAGREMKPIAGSSDYSLTARFAKADDMAAVNKVIRQMGYDLSEEDQAKVFEAFSRVARNKPVTAKELDAIIASSALQVPPSYTLVNYVINTGSTISSTAHIQLEKDEVVRSGICVGDGPIDAAFLAIEQIVGTHYELDDFQIQSVTEGREAMGSTLVKLRAGGKLFSGQGISTDIIGSAISAYLSALNKIVYEEN